MIYTDRTITVQNGTSKIDSSIILYRGDREVEITFAILQQSFKFAKSDNLINTTNASYGQLIIDRPDENYIFSDITECEEGKIKFTITQAMIDELVEVGFYTIQIRLYDEPMNSRITIPPIENVIEVREPIASEDTEVLRTDGKVDEGIVNYAEAVKSEPIADTDYFDNNGNYVKTVWNGGDLISQGKLNKIEGALSVINNKAANNSGSADIDLTDYAKKNDIPTKTSQLTNDSNFATESYVKNEIASAQLGAGDIEVDLSGYATKDELDVKQDKLVSGTNVKTINGASILGSGNITIESSMNNCEAITDAEELSLLNILGEVSITPDPDPEPEPIKTYTITNNLTNVTTNNTTETVNENTTYSATITVNEGYVLDTVTVTMSGTDITTNAYNNGIININSVTGNVVITVTAIVESTGEDAEDSTTLEMTQVASSIGWGGLKLYTDNGETTYSGRTLNSYSKGFYYSTETFDKDTELTIDVIFDYTHGSIWFFGACVPSDTNATNTSANLYYLQELGNVSTSPQTVTYTVRAGYKFVLAISKNHNANPLTITAGGSLNV